MKRRIFLIMLTLLIIFTSVVNASGTDKYKEIHRFLNYSEQQAVEIFNQSGIKYSTVYDYSEFQKGIVYKVKYYGHSSDENYYIYSENPVTIYVSKGIKQENTVYLTFDDGPTAESTDRVLKILDKYNIKASFCLVGQFMQYYPEKVKEIYNAGHTIVNHSSNHDYKTIYATADTLKADIKLWEDIMYDILGTSLDYKLYRFPGGTTTTYIDKSTYPQLISVLDELGYKAFDWTLANNDKLYNAKNTNLTKAEYLKASIIDTLKMRESTPNVPKIVLMHDTEPDTVNTLEWTINYFIDCGYTFGTLDQLDEGWLFP